MSLYILSLKFPSLKIPTLFQTLDNQRLCVALIFGRILQLVLHLGNRSLTYLSVGFLVVILYKVTAPIN